MTKAEKQNYIIEVIEKEIKEINGNEDVDVYFTIDNLLHNIGGKRNIFRSLRNGFYSVWCVSDVAFYMEFTQDYGFNYMFINVE